MSRLRNLKRTGPEFYGCHSVVNHDHDYHANDVIILGSCSGAETMAKAAKAPTIVFPALRDFHLEVMSDIKEWCGFGVSSSSLDTMMFFPLPEFVIQFLPDRSCLRIEVYDCLKLEIDVLLVDLLEKSGKTLRKLRVTSQRSSNISPGPWPSTTVSAASEKVDDDDDTKYHPNPKHYPFISLVSLTLYGWESLKYLLDQLQHLLDQLQHLITLRDLSLRFFYGLEALPEWLGNLSSLHSLKLYRCKILMNLPTLEAMQCLTNLQSMKIYNCPLLKKRCARGSGQEWHKIAHIPFINNNGFQVRVGPFSIH
ncbi:hypothetical protein TEA_028017 [Camellia sinensis var. sinensis]|uniref:R13L1/DRL21-like LRR repeat region domain-containing protein n=1 Tax=Camellia sinensis var. sinensis TaxID=542762 RepID=A0A4S4E0U4_CAMSN|nr:hypothetical protein TEA_028017 [Camellia sinensis var. sinensis]